MLPASATAYSPNSRISKGEVIQIYRAFAGSAPSSCDLERSHSIPKLVGQISRRIEQNAALVAFVAERGGAIIAATDRECNRSKSVPKLTRSFSNLPIAPETLRAYTVQMEATFPTIPSHSYSSLATSSGDSDATPSNLSHAKRALWQGAFVRPSSKPG